MARGASPSQLPRKSPGCLSDQFKGWVRSFEAAHGCRGPGLEMTLGAESRSMTQVDRTWRHRFGAPRIQVPAPAYVRRAVTAIHWLIKPPVGRSSWPLTGVGRVGVVGVFCSVP